MPVNETLNFTAGTQRTDAWVPSIFPSRASMAYPFHFNLDFQRPGPESSAFPPGECKCDRANAESQSFMLVPRSFYALDSEGSIHVWGKSSTGVRSSICQLRFRYLGRQYSCFEQRRILRSRQKGRDPSQTFVAIAHSYREVCILNVVDKIIDIDKYVPCLAVGGSTPLRWTKTTKFGILSIGGDHSGSMRLFSRMSRTL